jgi:hypothetical protein
MTNFTSPSLAAKLEGRFLFFRSSLLALLCSAWLWAGEARAADTAFLPLQASRLFAGSGTDLATAVASGPDGSAYFAGTFIGTITGSGGSITSNTGAQPDVFVTKLLPDGSTGWLLRIGGTLTEKAEAVAVDPVSGRVFVAGQFAGTAAFGTTNLTAEAGNDGFVACFETDGTLRWVRQIKGAGDETVFDLQVGTDGLHVCGSYNSSASWGSQSFTAGSGAVGMYLVKTDMEGVPSGGIYPQSTQTIQPKRILLLADGTRVVAGQFTGTLLFGGFRASNGVGDFFVSAYAANGSLSWLITGGGTGNDEANNLIRSAAGDLLLGASVELDSDGNGQLTDSNGAQTLPLAANGLRVARISAAGVYSPLMAVNGAQLGGLAEGQRGVLHLAGNFSTAVTLPTTVVNPPGGQASVFLASFLGSGELAGVATVSSEGAASALDMASTSNDGLALAGLGTTSLKYQEQTLASGHASLNAFTLLLAPPELRMKLARQGNQVRVTYPAYHHSAKLWESTTLGAWTEVSGAATLTLGEMQRDFDGTEAKRFFQLRYSTP